MKIAVCDEPSVQLTQILTELADEAGVQINIDVFQSYDGLSLKMKENGYDLLILDIGLNGEDGIAFVCGLRLKHPETDVIFISNSAAGALDAYAAFPVGYIVRPLVKKKLRAPFRRAASGFSRKHIIIFNDADGGKFTVPVDGILYIEVIGTELSVHTRGGVVYCVGSLAETFQKLPAQQFYRSHRSYIVNMNYITRAVKYSFIMENGDRVTIAKNRYAEAKRMLSGFAGN